MVKLYPWRVVKLYLPRVAPLYSLGAVKLYLRRANPEVRSHELLGGAKTLLQISSTTQTPHPRFPIT